MSSCFAVASNALSVLCSPAQIFPVPIRAELDSRLCQFFPHKLCLAMGPFPPVKVLRTYPPVDVVSRHIFDSASPTLQASGMFCRDPSSSP